MQNTQLYLKRGFDIVLSITSFIVLFPVLLLIALFVKLTSAGPVIFVQERLGKDSKKFKMYKFRTMRHCASSSERIFVEQKLKGNPRMILNITNRDNITSVGKFLRKYALDELPQLINILRGEMSFVGPRPITIEETNLLTLQQRDFLKVRPGLTCLWQISCGNSYRELDWKIQQDRYYIINQSFVLDLKILLKTFRRIIRI